MKKSYYLLIAMISFSFVNLAQSVYQEPVEIVENFTFNQYQKSLDSCGYSVNGYLTAKATSVEYYYLNVGDMSTTSSGAYPGRAQFYNANPGITVSGVSFYAFITADGVTSTDVVTSMYEALPDSTLGALIASDTIQVTATSFGSLPSIQYTSAFENPVVTNDAYILTVETMSNDSLTLVSNSFTNDDGAGENLGLSYYAWPSDPQYDGWFRHGWYAGWDADFLILPVVKAEIAGPNAFVLVTEDSLCLDEEATQIDYNQAGIFTNHMYSANSVSPLNGINYDFGEVQFSMTTTANHTFSSAGWKQIVARDTFKLWAPGGGFNSCLVSDTFDILVKDTVLNGDFITAQPLYEIEFYPATGSDSAWFVKWIFGHDGQESTELTPTYQYPESDVFYTAQMIIDNGCDVDTVEKQVQIVGLSEFQLSKVSIYPNPTSSGVFFISGLASQVNQVDIRNALGQTVYRKQPKGNQLQVDLSNATKGVYFITLESDDHKILTRKLIISK